MLQMRRLDIEDNADHWREKEHSILSDLVQRRLFYLQVSLLFNYELNPLICKSLSRLTPCFIDSQSMDLLSLQPHGIVRSGIISFINGRKVAWDSPCVILIAMKDGKCGYRK